MWQQIIRLDDVPTGCDVRLAVIENGEPHALVFPCRRVGNGWVDAKSGRKLEVHPTHFQIWMTAGGAA